MALIRSVRQSLIHTYRYVVLTYIYTHKDERAVETVIVFRVKDMVQRKNARGDSQIERSAPVRRRPPMSKSSVAVVVLAFTKEALQNREATCLTTVQLVQQARRSQPAL